MGSVAKNRCTCEVSGHLSFTEVRTKCPVLREIVIPDDEWAHYTAFIESDMGTARLRPILYLAHQRGELSKVTECLHAHLIPRLAAGEELHPNYRRDLVENWFRAESEERQHEKARGFMGKYMEFKVASWLEALGDQVVGLEAFGGEFDISAENCDIEVKYVGVDTSDFDVVVRAMQRKPAVHKSSPYEDADYVLFRLLEAAMKVSRSDKRRICALVLQDTAWSRVSLAFEDQWIDWRKPQFLSQTFPTCELVEQTIERKHWRNGIASMLESLPDIVDQVSFLTYSAHELAEVMRPINQRAASPR